MIVPLLPILLVANLSVNESDWKYGPELVYDVSMNGTEYRIVDKMTKIFVHNTTMKLKCRPKNQTNFSCLFHEPRVISSLVESDGNYSTVNDSKIFRDENPFVGDNSFEFNADRDSCDNHPYVTSSSISEQRLDIVRALMDTINVPAYLTRLPEGKVEILENSTVGIRCATEYVVKLVQLPENFEGKDMKRSYEILLAPGGKIRKGYSIRRNRFPGDCWEDRLHRVGLYSQHNQEKIYRVISGIDMIISNDSFFSKDITRFLSQKRDRHHHPDGISPMGEETISLSLEDIVPASGPLPVIRDPMLSGMPGTQLFHSNSALEWLFSKEEL